MTDVLDDPWIAEATRRFSANFVSAIADRKVELLGKDKAVLKFGRNIGMSANTRATLWDLGVAHETYLDGADGTSANLIDRSSSSNAGDTGSIRHEVHYLSEANKFHFCAFDLQMNGQTPVNWNEATIIVDAFGGFADLGYKAARCSRLANLSSTALSGDIYAYQNGQTVTAGVPQDLTLTHAKIRGASGFQQTNKLATTISNEDWGILTAARAGVGRQTDAFVDFSFEMMEAGGAFRERLLGYASRSSGQVPLFSEPPYLLVPPNADVRMTGNSSANTVQTGGSFNILLGRLV